ncbi:MAG: hypothetical protein A2161_19705 [Candidatus Schekmanbacteria bacterium RBG_13_48_7]|uniref:Nitroreductase domain-containing protein n=1 Tax=Candidatus Schekmanbacteria bacterium RBG_13_48_7 TaxID=1817878 RepID=A0A1F7S2Z8_9BACT|nr:MAG: hypothetical protein A2161_19705 [Candidatus Schekmanbacteria bacterium RBG_13_48_7]
MDRKEMPSHHGAKTSLDDTYPNRTLKLLIERASCRNFSDRNISSETMNLVLEAGIHSATGGNLQPYSIIKIENENTKQKLTEFCGQDFMRMAPVHLIFCIDWHRIERWANLEIAPFTATSAFRHFWISFQDTIICAQNVCVAADSVGLGSVYIGTILEFLPEIRDILSLPEGVLPVVLLCLGYPKSKPPQRKKLGIRTIVHSEKYHEIEDEKLLMAFAEKYPDLKVDISDERLDRIQEVCRSLHGEEFARKCIDKIKQNGYINPVQRYFCLHYTATEMPIANEKFLKIIEDFGFNWFKKFPPDA